MIDRAFNDPNLTRAHEEEFIRSSLSVGQTTTIFNPERELITLPYPLLEALPYPAAVIGLGPHNPYLQVNSVFAQLDPDNFKAITNALNEPVVETAKGKISMPGATKAGLGKQKTEVSVSENGPWYELHVSPLPCLDGETNAIVTLQDITRERDLLARNQNLQAENMGLKAKFQEISALIGGFVHDIRNPLTAIFGYALSLQRRWETFTPDKLKEVINTIVVATQKANSEITDTLESIDVLQEPKPEVIKVKDFIESVVEKNLSLATSKNIEVSTFASDESVPIDVDPKKLGSAFNTFFLNAAQSGASKVRMWSQRTKDGSVTIFVGDNGCGMSPEILAKCLESKFSTKGSTGKGLSIAKQNVESCGGKMLPPMSRIGIGSIFAVSLPISQ